MYCITAVPRVQPCQGELMRLHERLAKEKEQLREKEKQLRTEKDFVLRQPQPAALSSRRPEAVAGKACDVFASPRHADIRGLGVR